MPFLERARALPLHRWIQALAIPEVGAIMDTTDHASGRNPYYSPAK